MQYVKNVIRILESEFPDDWDDKILSVTKSRDGDLEVISILSSKISLTFEKVIYNLNLAVLSGEYLFSTDIEEDKRRITAKLNQIVNGIASSVIEFPNFQVVTYDLIYSLREPIIIALNNYSGLFKEIEKRYSNPEKSSLFTSILHEKFSVSQKIGIPEIKRLLNEFVCYNIPLAKIDHTLAVKSKQLEEALTIKHSVEKSIKEFSKKGKVGILKVLNDKCDYLVWKILTRYEKDPYNYFYALDYEDKQLDRNEFEPIVYAEFSDLSKKLYIHPNQAENFNKFEEYIKGLKRKYRCDTQLNFKETLALVKDLKDSPKTGINEIGELIVKFENAHKHLLGSERSFDNWAYEASFSYLHNNKLSAKLKCKDLVVVDIELEYFDLNRIQYNSDQKNYFPYLKLCQYLVDHILPCHVDSGDVESFGKAMELLELIEKSLYESFEWCSDRNFIPYQLPFNESVIPYEIEGEQHSLFLASSFVLPINFEKVDNEIKRISRNKEKYRNMIDMFSSIQKQKVEIEIIKEGIEKTDKRHIEILSIFAAIVLFVSSSIQVFAKAETFIDALRFMLVFGYVLVLFVFLIWMITRDNGVQDKKLPKFHKRLLNALVGATVIALGLIIFPPSKLIETKQVQSKSLKETVVDKDKLPVSNVVSENSDNISPASHQIIDSVIVKIPSRMVK